MAAWTRFVLGRRWARDRAYRLEWASRRGILGWVIELSVAMGFGEYEENIRMKSDIIIYEEVTCAVLSHTASQQCAWRD